MMIDPRMIALTQGVRGRILAKVGAGVAALALGVGQGFVSAHVLTLIFDGHAFAAVVPWIGVMAVLVLAQVALRWGHELLAVWIAAGVKLKLRQRLYARLLELGPGYLTRTQTGRVQSTIVDGVEAVEAYLGLYLPQVLIALIGPLAILTYLFTLDVLVGVVVLAGVLAGLFSAQAFERLLGEYGQRHWRAYQELNAEFLDSMQGLPTLKAFNAGRRQGEHLDGYARRLYRATMTQMAVSLAGTGLTNLAMAVGTALSVGIAAVQLARGELGATALFLVLFLSALCFQPLTELNLYWHQGFMGLSALAGIDELLNAQPEVEDRAADAAPPVVAHPRVAFERVTFSYGRGDRPALQDLSFSVAAGEKLALVGRSGSGKTTAVALLLRFFEPQQGRITVSGVDIRDYPLAELRRLVAVVSQDTYLFHGTVADNLRLARPAADQATLEEAARLANAHGFIRALEDGYETMVGERGLKLSGGQRQRLAIARALLKDAPILVLDEATASVDAANEAAIQDALDRLTADRPTLIIAHRLSTIANADRIVVLQDGEAVETGRHGELIDRRGAYARLIAAQRG